MKNILAIDPGTKCGWAALLDGIPASGVWDLKIHRYEGDGMRWIRLKKHLDSIGKVECIFFEEVRRHAGVIAAHVYGAAIGIITSWAESKGIQYCSVPVGTIKKFATGKGNADKKMMMEACKKKLKQVPTDDNHADALWILEWAKENYGDTSEKAETKLR